MGYNPDGEPEPFSVGPGRLPIEPAQPAEESEPGERFRTAIAIFIALVSIAGALVAWRASITSNEASTLDQTELQELAQKQQKEGAYANRVDEDLRLVDRYRAHVRDAELLSADATAARAANPVLADSLDAQAQSERAQAQALRAFFFAKPATGPASAIAYDRAFVMNYILTHDDDYQKLRPEATRLQAEHKHSKALNLIGLVTLFVAALFFLTLAQVLRTQIRIFAGAGAFVTLVALALWALLELTSA